MFIPLIGNMVKMAKNKSRDKLDDDGALMRKANNIYIRLYIYVYIISLFKVLFFMLLLVPIIIYNISYLFSNFGISQ